MGDRCPRGDGIREGQGADRIDCARTQSRLDVRVGLVDDKCVGTSRPDRLQQAEIVLHQSAAAPDGGVVGDLARDRSHCSRRTARPSLEALVAAIYLRYARYLSPLDASPCSALDVARLLAARRRRDSESEGVSHILGVQRWKDFHVRPFVQGDRSTVTYTMSATSALMV